MYSKDSCSVSCIGRQVLTLATKPACSLLIMAYSHIVIVYNVLQAFPWVTSLSVTSRGALPSFLGGQIQPEIPQWPVPLCTVLLHVDSWAAQSVFSKPLGWSTSAAWLSAAQDRLCQKVFLWLCQQQTLVPLIQWLLMIGPLQKINVKAGSKHPQPMSSQTPNLFSANVNPTFLWNHTVDSCG